MTKKLKIKELIRRTMIAGTMIFTLPSLNSVMASESKMTNIGVRSPIRISIMPLHEKATIRNETFRIVMTDLNTYSPMSSNSKERSK